MNSTSSPEKIRAEVEIKRCPRCDRVLHEVLVGSGKGYLCYPCDRPPNECRCPPRIEDDEPFWSFGGSQ